MLSAAAEGWACPMCQAAVASARSNLVSAYMWSILFLMAMPFTLLALMSGYMYWLVRRARAERAVQAAGESPVRNLVPGTASASLAPSANVPASV
jgi:hypothetical protein